MDLSLFIKGAAVGYVLWVIFFAPTGKDIKEETFNQGCDCDVDVDDFWVPDEPISVLENFHRECLVGCHGVEAYERAVKARDASDEVGYGS